MTERKDEGVEDNEEAGPAINNSSGPAKGSNSGTMVLPGCGAPSKHPP